MTVNGDAAKTSQWDDNDKHTAASGWSFKPVSTRNDSVWFDNPVNNIKFHNTWTIPPNMYPDGHGSTADSKGTRQTIYIAKWEYNKRTS